MLSKWWWWWWWVTCVRVCSIYDSQIIIIIIIKPISYIYMLGLVLEKLLALHVLYCTVLSRRPSCKDIPICSSICLGQLLPCCSRVTTMYPLYQCMNIVSCAYTLLGQLQVVSSNIISFSIYHNPLWQDIYPTPTGISQYVSSLVLVQVRPIYQALLFNNNNIYCIYIPFVQSYICGVMRI